jgi:pimeloyl-ACP methyl ester carboxylesterase
LPPGGRARGGVVICSPLAKEHVDTYRGLKLLAQQLASAGIAVLRFDYLGTGDSARDQGSDSAVEDFGLSVGEAVGYLRDCGVKNISLIGLRAGALLAALAAPEVQGLDGLVLWDPVADGRRYLREQRVLYKMTVGDDVIEADTESILGLTFSAAAARDLKSLKMPAQIAPSIKCLVLVRPERMDDEWLRGFRTAPNCTVEKVIEQAAFVEPASFVVEIPVGAIESVVTWLDSKVSTEVTKFTVALQHRAVVTRSIGGGEVVETIDRFGPNHLFGIRTALREAPANSPTMLMHGTACQHRIGQGRIWTESARELAGLGIAAMRYDRRGTGDTGVASTEIPRIYSDLAKQDVVDAVEATGVAPDRLMMTGVCSGAWSAAYAAIVKGAKSVVLINVILYVLRKTEVGPERLIGMTPPSPGDSQPEARTFRARAKDLARRWMPYRAWLMLGKLGVAQVPEVLLAELRRMNVNTEMVLSPEDVIWFEKQRGRESLARVVDATWVPNLVPASGGDHPLLQRDIQNFARQQLVRVAIRDFGPPLAQPAIYADLAERVDNVQSSSPTRQATESA